MALINYASVLYALGLLMFLPCYFGALIMFKSDELATNVYRSNWIQMASIHRKIIITFQERLKRVSSIVVGRLLLLSLETYASVNFFSQLNI